MDKNDVGAAVEHKRRLGPAAVGRQRVNRVRVGLQQTNGLAPSSAGARARTMAKCSLSSDSSPLILRNRPAITLHGPHHAAYTSTTGQQGAAERKERKATIRTGRALGGGGRPTFEAVLGEEGVKGLLRVELRLHLDLLFRHGLRDERREVKQERGRKRKRKRKKKEHRKEEKKKAAGIVRGQASCSSSRTAAASTKNRSRRKMVARAVLRPNF